MVSLCKSPLIKLNLPPRFSGCRRVVDKQTDSHAQRHFTSRLLSSPPRNIEISEAFISPSSWAFLQVAPRIFSGKPSRQADGFLLPGPLSSRSIKVFLRRQFDHCGEYSRVHAAQTRHRFSHINRRRTQSSSPSRLLSPVQAGRQTFAGCAAAQRIKLTFARFRGEPGLPHKPASRLSRC